jgi:hypothetical protein
LKNPTLLPITGVGLYTYFSGNVTRYEHTYSLSIDSSSSSRMSPPLADWKRILGIEFNRNDGRLSASANCSIYSRLLSLMGFYTVIENESEFTVRKGVKGSSLPQYLVDASKNYQTASVTTKPVIRQLMRDTFNIWADTKNTFHNNKWHLRLRVMSQPEQEKLISQAEIMTAITNIAYPEITLDINQFKHYVAAANIREAEKDRVAKPQRAIIHSGYFDLSTEQVASISKYDSSPFSIKIHVKPTFSFNHPRSLLRENSNDTKKLEQRV